jgi:hypothetical protein
MGEEREMNRVNNKVICSTQEATGKDDFKFCFKAISHGRKDKIIKVLSAGFEVCLTDFK